MTAVGHVFVVVVACLVLAGAPAAADVVDRSPSGFTVKTTVTVVASPQRIYQDLLTIGSWWDNAHTYSGDAKNLTPYWGKDSATFMEEVVTWLSQ